jgi:hypothetical protein
MTGRTTGRGRKARQLNDTIAIKVNETIQVICAWTDFCYGAKFYFLLLIFTFNSSSGHIAKSKS